jgi:hypothetical protein
LGRVRDAAEERPNRRPLVEDSTCFACPPPSETLEINDTTHLDASPLGESFPDLGGDLTHETSLAL